MKKAKILTLFGGIQRLFSYISCPHPEKAQMWWKPGSSFLSLSWKTAHEDRNQIFRSWTCSSAVIEPHGKVWQLRIRAIVRTIILGTKLWYFKGTDRIASVLSSIKKCHVIRYYVLILKDRFLYFLHSPILYRYSIHLFILIRLKWVTVMCNVLLFLLKLNQYQSQEIGQSAHVLFSRTQDRKYRLWNVLKM